MSAQAIQQLRVPPSEAFAHNSVVDTLNRNFPDTTHLGDLDQILGEASTNQAALRQQLSESEKTLDSLITRTRVEALTQLENARDFSSQRDNIEDELAYLSHSLVSSLSPAGEDNGPTLLEDIETMHRSLKELENVRAYVAVVERALALSEAAVSQLRSSVSPVSAASASVYDELHAFIDDVTRSCKAAEDIGNSHGSIHLVSFLETIREKTWANMKAVLSAALVSASESINWPTSVDFLAASKEARSNFELAFSDMLRLQEIGQSLRSPLQGRECLDPLEALVQPVALRFKYHFDGERETNQLDKPEWYLTHIANVAHDHRPFMEGVVQRLLVGTRFQNVNAWYQYTTLLLGILDRKIKRSMPKLVDHPALLAHTIYQALIFDSTLRDLGYEFDAVANKNDEEMERGGISRIILDQKEWFDAWLEGEKKFADDQYHEIISASDAWLIADDSPNNPREHIRSYENDLKATNSARRIKALVEQITDRYMPIPSFRQRTQFLVHVQVPVLESYHSRISSSLDAFETLSSALVRAVPGALGVDATKADSRRLTGGVEGSQRLCKALLSARYIEHTMKAWGEEVFFLELWAEINRRVHLRTRVEEHPSLPEPSTRTRDAQEAPEGTIFEELVIQYEKLSLRAEDMLVQQICGECEAALKPHFASLASTSNDEGATDDLMVPPTLLPSIALLSSHLTFLRTSLPSSTVTHLYRRIASRIAEHILQREVLFRPGLTRVSGGRQVFTRRQARAVHAECELWAETCQVALNTSRARAEKPWSRLLTAGRLMGTEMQGYERACQVLLGEGQEGSKDEDKWEDAMDEITGLGSGALGRDEVKALLRLRGD